MTGTTNTAAGGQDHQYAGAEQVSHAPLPWSVQNSDDIWEGDEHPTIPLFKAANHLRSWGREYPHAERHANAAFIVRACNAHDDLLAALKRIVTAYDLPGHWQDEVAQAMGQARAAIARAEGR